MNTVRLTQVSDPSQPPSMGQGPAENPLWSLAVLMLPTFNNEKPKLGENYVKLPAI